MKKILVVGQTPPPFGGQAMMIDYLLTSDYQRLKLYHVRMHFSHEMNDMGKFQFRKILHLLHIIFKIYYYRIFKQVKYLYYPPSGPTSAVFRDIAILLPTRFLFKKTIFHFHASGLSEHLINLKGIKLYAFKKSFYYPDVCIHLSESCPKEGDSIFTKENVIVPNGVPDLKSGISFYPKSEKFNILFIGLLETTKGELDLLKAIHLLKKEGYNVSLTIAGQFKRTKYKTRFFELVKSYSLEKEVIYKGIVQGEEKIKIYQQANCFCFPSYFHSESFPLVLIESMQFSLPIIASRWRGIPDLIEDGVNGFLIDIKSPEQIVDKVKILIDNPALLSSLGKTGRQIYENNYTINEYRKRMEKVFNIL